MTARGPRAVSTVFLDRDGTINVRAAPGEYITSPAGLVLLPGAARAVADLNAAGLRTVLVTNQRWLSGPAGDERLYAAIHARLEELLAAEGARLDAAYYCPHAAGTCDCRKPAPGMLRRTASELGFDLADAVMIGDSDTDVLAGKAAGAATILLTPSHADPAGPHPDMMASHLASAVGLILKASYQPASG
jgi:D-glycero-D-manno-heptose 1,7-bisphosphate phosphatase